MTLLLLFGSSGGGGGGSVTQTVTMQAKAGLTGHQIVLRNQSTGAEVDTQSASEIASGVYSAAFTDAPAGTYFVQLVDSSGSIVRFTDATLTLDTATFPLSGSGGGAEQATLLEVQETVGSLLASQQEAL